MNGEIPVACSTSGYGPYFGSIPDFGGPPKGVRFSDVRDGSPAAKAGFKAGDVMIEFDGKKIDNLYDFTYALRAHKPGDTVKVKFARRQARRSRGSVDKEAVSKLGFAVWIDSQERVAWARGTHEYRPWEQPWWLFATSSARAILSPRANRRRICASCFAGFFGSLETVNEFLRSPETRTLRRTPASLALNKIERRRIQTIPFAVGGGPSSNTWPKCASHLRHNTSVLNALKLWSSANAMFSLGDRRPKTRPTGIRIKLLLRTEHRIAAAHASINPRCMIVPVEIMKRRFRSLAPSHIKLLAVESASPFTIRTHNLAKRNRLQPLASVRKQHQCNRRASSRCRRVRPRRRAFSQ